MKEIVLGAVMVFISTAIALGAGESILRIKNSSMQNYDIEMWRYAKELKQRSDDPILGHEHIPARSAVLQSVNIRINEQGLRGGPVAPLTPGKRRILFLGSSVTMGWGVPEEQVLTERLRRMFTDNGLDVDVLNAGIGNYNSVRYVERFLTKLTPLEPTDIVVDFFLRDAETLDAGGGNFLLRNSQLAVTLWIAFTRYFGASSKISLEDHYRAVYQPNAPGFVEMQKALAKLAEYARAHKIRIYFAMTPDVHDLVDYKFGYIHDLMRDIAGKHGYKYVDLLPAMRNLTPSVLWSMPGDPHPNGLGHQRMAEAIFPALQLAAK